MPLITRWLYTIWIFYLQFISVFSRIVLNFNDSLNLQHGVHQNTTTMMTLHPTQSYKIYEGLPTNEWNQRTFLNLYHNNVSSLPVISLTQLDNYGSKFNLCDENTYSAENIETALGSDNLRVLFGQTEVRKWVLYVNVHYARAHCNNLAPKHLLYTSYTALIAQDIGALAVLHHGANVPAFECFVVPPLVNSNQQTVKDTKINIPIFASLMPLGNEIDFTVSDDGQFWYLNVSDIHDGMITFDPNPYTDILQPYGLYRFSWFGIGIYSSYLTYFIIRHFQKVIDYYRLKTELSSSSPRMAIIMRLLILFPEIMCGITRTVLSFDPLGVFLYYDYFIARMQFNVTSSLATFTDIVTIFYCWDVYKVYQNSRKLKQFTPFVEKYKFGILFIISIALVMIILDQIILYLSMIGGLGTTSLAAPLLYLIVVNVTSVVLLVWIGTLMHKEVKITLMNISSTYRSADRAPRTMAAAAPANKKCTSCTSGTTGKASSSNAPEHPARKKILDNNNSKHTINSRFQIIIDRTEALLRMRNYIMLAALGRCVTLGIFMFFISHSGVRDSFGSLPYALSIWGMGASNAFSSTCQIFAALQLPTGDDGKDNARVMPSSK